jgi:RimJ/RimL family protein N-acetyltransferase
MLGGTVALRPEQPEDAVFLRALFQTTVVLPDGLSAVMAESLLDMQFRGQTASYPAAYPDACFAIIESATGPWGRIIYTGGPAACIVDYALLPAARGTGVGTAVLRAVLARIGGPVQSTVLATNHPCLSMCRRLGFTILEADSAFVRLEWRPG